MKFINIKKLIIKFIGGGIIKFPTRFLRWVIIDGENDEEEGGGGGGDIDLNDIYDGVLALLKSSKAEYLLMPGFLFDSEEELVAKEINKENVILMLSEAGRQCYLAYKNDAYNSEMASINIKSLGFNDITQEFDDISSFIFYPLSNHLIQRQVVAQYIKYIDINGTQYKYVETIDPGVSEYRINISAIKDIVIFDAGNDDVFKIEDLFKTNTVNNLSQDIKDSIKNSLTFSNYGYSFGTKINLGTNVLTKSQLSQFIMSVYNALGQKDIEFDGEFGYDCNVIGKIKLIDNNNNIISNTCSKISCNDWNHTGEGYHAITFVTDECILNLHIGDLDYQSLYIEINNGSHIG